MVLLFSYAEIISHLLFVATETVRIAESEELQMPEELLVFGETDITQMSKHNEFEIIS